MTVLGPDGQLRDFIWRPGDPDISLKSRSHRWGWRGLLSGDPALLNSNPAKAKTRATAIATQDMGVPTPINVQVRFALNDPVSNIPILPFTPIYPFGFGQLEMTVRRGIDPDSPVTVDQFNVEQTFFQVCPFDTLVQRQLGVDLFFNPLGVPVSLWVEVIATPVHDIGTRNKIPGWPVVNRQAFVAAVASPANVTLILDTAADRAQFIIVNTSTNADLIVSFNPPGTGPLAISNASWVGPVGTLILPMGGANTYESPVGGYRGRVSGSWNNAVPNGGALVTEGTYF